MVDFIQEKMTREDYMRLPESKQFTQLIDGELLMSPSPTFFHQLIAGEIYSTLKELRQDGTTVIAPIDVHLDDENIVQPDVLWLAPESQCQHTEGYLYGAPELLVEILSPGTAHLDVGRKFQLYEQYGVQEYWIVDLNAEFVIVWQRFEGRFQQFGTFTKTMTFVSPLLKKEIVLPQIFSVIAADE